MPAQAHIRITRSESRQTSSHKCSITCEKKARITSQTYNSLQTSRISASIIPQSAEHITTPEKQNSQRRNNNGSTNR